MMKMTPRIKVIGAGLAGSEASWQLAERGFQVDLFEMRPRRLTPAHKSGNYGELVCSNSLGASNLGTAGGLLKAELRQMGSLIMSCADTAQIPAGGALAVDREIFSQEITARIDGHPNIFVHKEICLDFPAGPAIIATGPLTEPVFAKVLGYHLGEDMLHFFDAASPIIAAESIDFGKVFWGSRYGKGGADYLNCPLNRDEYYRFYSALIEAETAELTDFENVFFENCLPIEVLAKRGPKSLAFGPLKPVGLNNPHSEEKPYAVVQLRRENSAGSMFNLVGFQTNLRWGEQKRVFRLVPGLEKAEFYRYGVMHRNSFINSPGLLMNNYQLKQYPSTYIAGQLAGVEGYLESTGSGLVAALSLWGNLIGRPLNFPRETMLGALAAYVCRDNDNFQPMNANYGLLPPIEGKMKKAQRREEISQRSLKTLFLWAQNLLL